MSLELDSALVDVENTLDEIAFAIDSDNLYHAAYLIQNAINELQTLRTALHIEIGLNDDAAPLRQASTELRQANTEAGGDQ